VNTNRERILEDARSISEGLWRMARLAQEAAETLDSGLKDEDMDGRAEAAELREALEHVQTISLEVSEQLDAYQDRYAG
jgi:phosphate uptake regulator